jgi:hypothetical protein
VGTAGERREAGLDIGAAPEGRRGASGAVGSEACGLEAWTVGLGARAAAGAGLHSTALGAGAIEEVSLGAGADSGAGGAVAGAGVGAVTAGARAGAFAGADEAGAGASTGASSGFSGAESCPMSEAASSPSDLSRVTKTMLGLFANSGGFQIPRKNTARKARPYRNSVFPAAKR